LNENQDEKPKYFPDWLDYDFRAIKKGKQSDHFRFTKKVTTLTSFSEKTDSLKEKRT
jgi:hypothetical protein